MVIMASVKFLSCMPPKSVSVLPILVEEITDFLGVDQQLINSFLMYSLFMIITVALCAAVNSCNLGFDIGVSTSVGTLIQEDFNLSNIQREVFVGSLNFFAMFGAFSSNYFSDRYGRRQTFLVAAMGFIFGIIICALSPGFGVLLLGRMFVGLGVGVGMAVRRLC